MKVDVDADISTPDRITMTFDQLPLDEAPEHIFKHRTNYAYSRSVDSSSGRITKIVVLTIGAREPPKMLDRGPAKTPMSSDQNHLGVNWIRRIRDR
jgi:hypothetical protein